MDKQIHILHLEDDEADAELVRESLAAQGIASEIKQVQTREEYCAALKESRYDVVLADYRLPMYDGMSALRHAQECGSQVPFIFVSGTMGEDAAIEALTKGATDYVLKTKLSRLAPAIVRALREAEAQGKRQRAEEEVRRVNRALRMLSDSNQTLIRSKDESSLLNEVCRIVVEVGGYRMAWVGFADNDEGKTVRPVAHAGFDSGYIESARISWADDESGRGPGGVAIRTGQNCVVRDISSDSAFVPWKREALQRGYRSMVALPLILEGKTLGALGIYAAEADAFDAREVETLTELASDLAFGIGALRAQAARTQAEAKLELFRQLTNQSNDAIFVVDAPTARLLDVNDTACSALGYAREELLDLGVTQIDATISDAAGWQEHLSIMRRVGSMTLESRHRHKDGATFPVEVSVRHTVRNQQEYLVAVARNISERKQAEEALRRSKADLQLALEGGRLGDWKWDVVSGEIVWSARCKALYGLPPEAEVTFERFLELVHPDDRHRIESALKHTAQAGADYEEEKRVIWPDGTLHWQMGRARVFRDHAGRPLQVTGVTIDITERKEAEEAMRRSERKKTILNQIADIFLTVPDDEIYGKVLSVVLDVLQSRFGIFGFIEENGDLVIPSMTSEVWGQCEVAGKSVTFPPASWGDSLWGRAIRERKAFRSEGPFHVPEGHLGIIRFVAVPVVFGEKTIGLISAANKEQPYTPEEQDLLEGISSSISPILNARIERDRQEQRRRTVEESLRKLSRAVEHSPASIMITDRAGKIEYINPRFTQLTGYTRGEVMGQNPRILKSGETPPQEYERLWQTITSGKEWRGEFHNRKKSGELYWETASISPIFDSTGEITHFVAVKEDITVQRGLEQDLRQAQKLEAVGQLAGGVAHDFNNILTAILLNLNMLKSDRTLTPEMVAGLEELEHEANRAASLTRQLLVFSRRQVMMAKTLDLGEVVNNMTKMLRRLIGEDIHLVFKGQGSGLWVMADAGMMDQLVMNLCVNARDAMPDGGTLTVSTKRTVIDAESASAKSGAHPGTFVCLSVADTGCGMDEETRKHIFEPFFTTKEVGKGTGLGLATVHGVVEQHHGWIEVQSKVNAGTVFDIYLPAMAEGSVVKASEGPIDVRGGTETVLVVEDDQSLRRFVSLSLRVLGYVVLEAANGSEALQLWEQHRDRIQLLLTDVVMPSGWNGIALAERLMQEKRTLKVIVTSGYSTDRAKPDVLAAKGIAFVPKPYSLATLAGVLRSCLDANRSGSFPGGAKASASGLLLLLQ